MSEPVDRTSKQALRQRLVIARRGHAATPLDETARGLAEQVISLVQRMGSSTVAAYVSIGFEPPTELVLERLHAQGTTVLLPVLREDNDLDWAPYVPGEFRPGRLGLTEPTSVGLGITAIRSADVIFCPGLAGSPAGQRLGRGGGSYDRALSRALPESLRCLLLYDDEVLPSIPTEPHDQRVDVLITPTRTITTTPGRC
ncbi:MAG: 5-formyltetrahydrofolate cyclo-ligase [Nocardioidaceae bacterium]